MATATVIIILNAVTPWKAKSLTYAYMVKRFNAA